MIEIAVCDDEEIVLSELRNKIKSYMEHTNFLCQIFEFSNAERLLKSQELFDIVFLDIQMDGMTGMEAAKKLRQEGSESFFVFVTVLKEYVYDAFTVEASDYLLKPIENERFISTMNRILGYIGDREKNKLLIQKESWCKSIRFADILYCEAINRKIFVHTKQGVINYYFKIEELEKQLGPCFFRCHRSYLVNLKYVCGYENGMAELENGESILVSRLRQQDFKKAVLCFMKERRK
ncbi:putative two-component response regulator [Oscillibacter valericigenes Sjm18-20]|nr:putative two-component response regulator [Oscillibacter valericigenes Sjm18-20]